MREIKIRRNCLMAAASLLVLVYLWIKVGTPFSWTLTTLFNLDGEANIPAWFSSILWFLNALKAWQCSGLVKPRPSGQSLFWQVTAVIMLAFSCDEVATMHEFLGKGLKEKFFPELTYWSAWVIFLGPVLFVLGVLFVVKARQYLPSHGAIFRNMALGCTLFLAGALFSEIVAHILDRSDTSLAYTAEVVVEEYLEMLGAIWLGYALEVYRNVLKNEI